MGLTLRDEIDQLLQAHVLNFPPFRFQFNKIKKEWNKKGGFILIFSLEVLVILGVKGMMTIVWEVT